MNTRLAVRGAGPGGYVAAFHAADLGMQVALIDADPNPGGVCTFRGCIPSKALLHAARVLDEAKHATAFGVSFARPSIDVDRLRAWKDQVVKKQTGRARTSGEVDPQTDRLLSLAPTTPQSGHGVHGGLWRSGDLDRIGSR